MIISRSCDGCGTKYETTSKRSRFCSGTCRTRASRAGDASVVPIRPAPIERDGLNVEACRAALDALGGSDSILGAQALTLAARLDASSRETGNSTAAVSRELRAVMAEVRALAQPVSAVTKLRDVLAERRAAR